LRYTASEVEALRATHSGVLRLLAESRSLRDDERRSLLVAIGLVQAWERREADDTRPIEVARG
jgi:hypothetical protein